MGNFFKDIGNAISAEAKRFEQNVIRPVTKTVVSGVVDTATSMWLPGAVQQAPQTVSPESIGAIASGGATILPSLISDFVGSVIGSPSYTYDTGTGGNQIPTLDPSYNYTPIDANGQPIMSGDIVTFIIIGIIGFILFAGVLK